MPKYQPELGTKLIIPEEEMITEDIDQDVPDQWDLENPDHVKVSQGSIYKPSHSLHTVHVLQSGHIAKHYS